MDNLTSTTPKKNYYVPYKYHFTTLIEIFIHKTIMLIKIVFYMSHVENLFFDKL